MKSIARERDSVYCMDATSNVVLQVWRHGATVDRIDRTLERVRELSRHHPGPIGIVVRVLEGCGLPEPRATRAFSHFIREVEDEVAGIAVVLEGRGLWAASMRAVVSTVTLMARAGPPTRVYSGLPEACEAIFELLSDLGDHAPPKEELLAAFEALGEPAEKGERPAEDSPGL